MTALFSEGLRTDSQSFSFYLGPEDRDLLWSCSERSDGVTLRGSNAPAVVKAMRRSGFSGAVLFDREGWRDMHRGPDQREWIRAQ